MDQCKKEKLCFKYGKPGYMSRSCRPNRGKGRNGRKSQRIQVINQGGYNEPTIEQLNMVSTTTTRLKVSFRIKQTCWKLFDLERAIAKSEIEKEAISIEEGELNEKIENIKARIEYFKGKKIEVK